VCAWPALGLQAPHGVLVVHGLAIPKGGNQTVALQVLLHPVVSQDFLVGPEQLIQFNCL